MSNAFAPPGADAPRDPTLGMTTDGMFVVVSALLGMAGAVSGLFMLVTALVTVMTCWWTSRPNPGTRPSR